jgi:diguanylate cyclase (GGDEF)-like protein/PAS domain S-box-containing protein
VIPGMGVRAQLNTDCKQTDLTLEIQRDFNELIATITSRFVDVSPANLDAEIERSLQEIGETIGMDTNFVFKFDDQAQTLSMTHQWSRPGYPRTMPQAQNIPWVDLAWSLPILKRREVVRVPWVPDLPPEAAIDQANWQQHNITALLFIPLVQKSEVTGFLGFTAHQERLNLNEGIVRLLQVMGQTIANAQTSVQDQIALRESESRWQFALEGAGDGVWDWNAATNTVFFSRQWKAMLGYEDHEIGTSLDEWDSRIHPDDKAGCYEDLERHFAGQTPIYQNEHRVQCKDGSYRWILDRGKVIEWTADGKPLRVIGTHTDVTERKQAETQLQQLTTRFELAAQSARMGIWEWDVVADQLIWDDRLCEIYGRRPEDFDDVFDAWKAGVHPDDLSNVWQAVEQALSGVKDFDTDFRIVLPDGTVRHIEAHALVQRDCTGRPLKMFGVTWDMTHRKALEQELLNKQQMLKAFVMDSPVGACILDHQLRFTLVNDALAEMHGVPAADHVGKYSWEIVPDLTAQHREIWRRVLQNGETIMNVEIVGETPQQPGVVRTWSSSFFPLLPSDGQPMAIGIIVLETTERSRAEQSLRDSEEKFRQLAENIQEVFWLTDVENQEVIYVSPAYERIWGRSCDSVYANPTSFIEAIHSDDQQYARDIMADASVPTTAEYRVLCPDGNLRWVCDRSFPIFNEAGQLIRQAGLTQDITAQKQAATQLQDLTERLGLAVQSANMGIWEWDLVTHHLRWDERMFTLYNLCAADVSLSEDLWRSVVHPEDLPVADAMQQKALAGEADYQLEFRVIWPDGAIRHIASYAIVQRNAEGKPLRMVGVNLDISDRKQAEAQLVHNALHDALTDLPNRTALINRLESAIQRSQRSETYHFAVLFLDLDQFKVINDSLGHLVGDKLLKQVAQKLQGMVRPTDLAARLGGDEFVILLEHIPDIQAVIHMAERLLADFRRAMDIETHCAFITTSVGIVWGTRSYTNAADLLRDADIALYRAKLNGRNRYEIFDVEMHIQAVKRMTLEHGLRLAINRQEFIPYYQPIVDLNTQRLTGFEALIRWQHPTRGFISPAEFIPIAEETGLILPISQWILQAACEQVATWQQQFPAMADIRISVNLSGHDLRQPHLVDTIRQILRQTKLPATSLTLEVTESMLIENIETTITLLEQLRDPGIRISIDDFGTGYSSLSYLYNLPADYLKIDQSFVGTMRPGGKNYKIVQAIVSLSDQLELAAIAEGIETAQQLEWLQALGCEGTSLCWLMLSRDA